MRTLPRFSAGAIGRQLLTVSLLIAGMLLLSHFGHHAGVATAAAPLLLGDVKSFGKTYSYLQQLIKPADADQPESIPSTLWDMQPYAAAGQAQATFFANATAANSGDATLSNFALGQLEGGYYFEIHRVFFIFDAMPANVAAVTVGGPANDVEIIHKTARGTLSFSMKGKTYGPHKLAFFGRPGGPLPTYAMFQTAAASTTSTGQTENNGGFPFLGNIIIPPVTQFKAVAAFNSTAISALTLMTVAMMGILHRPLA